MSLIRTVILAFLIIGGGDASASVTSFNLNGTLNNADPEVADLYSNEMPVSVQFSIDDGFYVGYPESHFYYGGLSGVLNVGLNTIRFSNSLAYVATLGQVTYVTMLGGNAFGSGGSITEMIPHGDDVLTGFQIMFIISAVPFETPINELLANMDPQRGSLYLNYSNDADPFFGVWGNVSSIDAIPEPPTAPMAATGALLMFFILRRSRKRRA